MKTTIRPVRANNLLHTARSPLTPIRIRSVAGSTLHPYLKRSSHRWIVTDASHTPNEQGPSGPPRPGSAASRLPTTAGGEATIKAWLIPVLK